MIKHETLGGCLLMAKHTHDIDLSIIIPTYNRAYIIRRAIQSVLNQTYQDFEIFIVDDGSKDNTHKIVESIRDERIRYIRHEINKGQAAARNTGIMAAKGKYIAFLDSDDEWLPEKLEKQMAAFRNAPPQVGVVYVRMLNAEGNRKTFMPPPHVTKREGNLYYDLLVDPTLVFPSAAAIRRDCFTKVGMFDEHFYAGEDWDLWIRIAKYYHFKYIDELLVVRSVMPDSLVNKYDCNTRVHEQILEKHYDDIKKDKRRLARYYVHMGDYLCSKRQLQRGRQYFRKATTTYPLNIESLAANLASLLGQSSYDRTLTSYKKMREWWFTRKR